MARLTENQVSNLVQALIEHAQQTPNLTNRERAAGAAATLFEVAADRVRLGPAELPAGDTAA
jgi:hypothetical protein